MYPTIDGKEMIPVGCTQFNDIGCDSFDNYLLDFLAVPYTDKNGNAIDRLKDESYVCLLYTSAMINIADSVDIPMLVGGNIKRLEDVKKYIYTGAKKAVLNVDTDMHLLEEASSRFGSDNIALISNYNLSEDIEKKISLVITTKENIESLKDVLYISNNVEAVADNKCYGVCSCLLYTSRCV